MRKIQDSIRHLDRHRNIIMTSTSSQLPTKTNSIKKAAFIKKYRDPAIMGNITTVCETIDIDRSTYYDWLEKDEGFRALVAEAKMQMCDTAEEVLYTRGLEKDTTALIYWLKNRHPDFNENERKFNQTNVQVNIPILGELKAE